MKSKMRPSEAIPPEHLSSKAKAIWLAVVPEKSQSVQRLTLLQAALESLDRADAARTAIAVEGMITKTERSGVLHVHPLVKVERESRQQFAKLWRDLGFNQSDMNSLPNKWSN